MPLLPLALAAAPGLLQIGQGIFQNGASKRVKYQDLTPEAFKEELAASRLSANNQRMPGEGAAVDRINAGVANSYNNAVQAGTGSAGILSTLGRLNANRNSALVGLGQQAAQFRLGQQARLSQNLRQQANYQQQSRDAFNREKSALKQAAATNIFGGVSTIAGAGITAATGGFSKDAAKTATAGTGTPATTAYNPADIEAILNYQKYRRGSGMYGTQPAQQLAF